MTDSTVSRQQLLAENAALRTRLTEAEETLRAIQGGEADALVLFGSDGDYIHTMQDALEPYRVMVEAMSEGAATLARDGTILYCNSHFAAWVKLPREQITGMALQEMIAKQDRARFDAMLPQGAQEVVREELTLQAHDGTQTPALFSMSPLPQSEGKVISVVIADLCEVVAAAAARSRLALIVESSDDAIISTTLDGVVESWNRAAEELYGYTAGEAIGHTIDSLIVPPERIHEVKEELAAIRQGERTLFLDSARLRKDGTQILVSIKASPILDDAGKVVGTSINARDISERKKTEFQLQRFRNLVDESNDAVLVIDPDGARFLDVNKQACSNLGYSRDELLAMDVLEIEATIPDGFAWDAHVEAVKKSGSMMIEGAHKRKDGSSFAVEVSVKYVALEEGSYIIAIARDITERKKAELALRNKESQLSEALTIAKIGYWEYDFSADEFIFNDQYYSLHKITAADAGGYRMSSADFANRYVFPDDVAEVGKQIQFALETRNPDYLAMIEARILTGDRKIVWVEVRFRVEKDLLGNTIRLIGVNQDISEHKQAEANIKYLNRVLSVLSGINSLIVRVKDRDELFRGACNIATEEGGFRMAMIVVVDPVTRLPASIISAGKNEELLAEIKSVMSSSEGMQTTLVAQVIREMKAIISNDVQNDPSLLFGKDYSEAGVKSMVVLPLVVSSEASGVLALYASEIDFFQEDEMNLLTELADDIAFAIDHLDKQERLNYLAYYDELTGLANRTLFLERVAQYIRSADSSGKKLAIGLIDLERFRNINDSLGRAAGDALLKQAAEWLSLKVGDANLLARIDADHFAIVLPEVKSDGNLMKLTENLMAAFLEHRFLLSDAQFRIGIKVGIALFPDDGGNADILFRNAEAALKNAKEIGERYQFHTQKMTELVAGKLSLENKLREAIDKEEFVLHYQPKVNLMSGKVTSAEALIRWNDPRTGLVPPGMFIPILEETGLIYEVGRWALHKAIEDNMRWRAAGLATVRIAVNVSPLQLRNINFIDEIRQVVALDAHAAAGLELEITESVIMNNIEFNIATLQTIRAMGVTIAIDDFGTGFSSLAYLSKLPVDTLKIDRSFVIEMTAGPQGLSLVSTIINLAHAMKLKVVAEGVETEEQLNLLRLLNCDEMQGYLFSKPVPAEIFEAKFLASSPVG